MEAVLTNIIGAENIRRAALAVGTRLTTALVVTVVMIALFHLVGMDRSVLLLIAVAPLSFSSVTFASLENLDVTLATNGLSLSLVIALALSMVVVFVAIAITDKGQLAANPEVELIGIPESSADGEPMAEVAYEAAVDTVEQLPKARRRDPDSVAEAVRRGVRAALAERWGKKPPCYVQVMVV